MPINRREFLKLAGTNLGAMALPGGWLQAASRLEPWPALSPAGLPAAVAAILDRAPNLSVGPDGYLSLPGDRGRLRGRAPQAYTQWNLEQRRRVDRLYAHVSWGIVLHWYGEKDNFDRTVRGYLRGFDSLREVDGRQIRTSAHFVVGDAVALPEDQASPEAIGLLQTQAPDRDGIPFLASHLRPLDILGHKEEQKQYFVRALYALGRAEPGARSLLQEMYDGRQLDPNLRTIAVEICGWDFENPAHFPSEQKIANVVALVWALMRRYGIPAANLLGHHEIQLNKADPGKKFMALIRFLIGAKALVEGDERMKALVFGPFLEPEGDRQEAVKRYFQFTRDYLVMISTPRRVYEWEACSKHWFLYDTLCGVSGPIIATQPASLPLQSGQYSPEWAFLNPENHEGVDLSSEALAQARARSASTVVHLTAAGNCLYTGELAGAHHGRLAIFRHRQPDGAEFLSVFEHLDETGEIRTERGYPAGAEVGRIAKIPGGDPFLHFAIAYGATWESDLSRRPSIPLNAGLNWIRDRYLDPILFLGQGADGQSRIVEGADELSGDSYRFKME
jgi:hypothetical protein